MKKSFKDKDKDLIIATTRATNLKDEDKIPYDDFMKHLDETWDLTEEDMKKYSRKNKSSNVVKFQKK